MMVNKRTVLNKTYVHVHARWTKSVGTKGHVKIIFLLVIALLFPHFCPKLEQTLHKQQEQHCPHAVNIFF